VKISEMKTDIQHITEECRDAASLLHGLEKAAVNARGADEQRKSAALGEVTQNVRAITASLERIVQLAGHRRSPRTGIPDPVTDLDQDPQD
jgi:hypothetical protein